MKKILTGIAGLALALALTGCTSAGTYSGSTYSTSEARRGQTMRIGTIIDIQNVTIQGDEGNALGGIGGAVLGAALGSTIGGGSGKTVATAAGGVGGALLGSKVGEKMAQHAGLEITVQYPDGQCEVIVQEPGKDALVVGQQIRVLRESDGTKRVRPLPPTMVPATPVPVMPAEPVD